MTNHVTFEDCDRLVEKGYFQITEQMVQELMATEDVDEWRNILFQNTIQGYDVSFAFMYDPMVEYIRNKITKGRGKKRPVQLELEPETKEPVKEPVKMPPRVEEKQPIVFKHAQKREWGTYRRSESIPYTSREVFLLERLIKMGYHSGSIYDIYNQSYDVKSKSAVVTKVVRIRKSVGKKGVS